MSHNWLLKCVLFHFKFSVVFFFFSGLSSSVPCLSLWQVFSAYHSMPWGLDSNLTTDTEKWHAILNPQPSSSHHLFSVLSYSHSAVIVGWSEMAFWVTLVGTSFWVLVGMGVLDKWWCFPWLPAASCHPSLRRTREKPNNSCGQWEMSAWC